MINPRLQRGALVAAFLAMVTAAACQSNSPTTPPNGPLTTAVTFSGGVLTAELAVTGAQRDSGLMHRTTLAANGGMLFAYPYTQQPEFAAYWMMNTPIALSIAYLDSTKKVINIEDMQPNTATLHYAQARFLYAIEANLGWFASHGVTAGSMASFTLPPGTTPTQ